MEHFGVVFQLDLMEENYHKTQLDLVFIILL